MFLAPSNSNETLPAVSGRNRATTPPIKAPTANIRNGNLALITLYRKHKVAKAIKFSSEKICLTEYTM